MADLLALGGEGPGTVEGDVTRVVFRNDENGYSVLRVSTEEGGDPVTVVGRVDSVVEGERVSARGSWVTDSRFGKQFKADRLETKLPASSEGMERYLASNLVKGIGPVYAKKLMEAFGDEVLDVIDRHPERLDEVPGIGRKRKVQILEAWQVQRSVREVMVFLHSQGLGAARAAAVHDAYGADAIRIVRGNPYRLARDIRGIGFRIADQVAMRLGIERNAPVRLQAGILHVLSEATRDGHCGLPEEGEEGLLARGASTLGVDEADVAEALASEVGKGTVKRDTADGAPAVFLRELHADERVIAAGVGRLLRSPLPWKAIDAEAAVGWARERTGTELSPTQRAALVEALRSKVIVITGGPGVGKTTIVNSLLQIVAAKGVEVELCAPTGRAANRLAGTTGMPARTIHRLLEINPRVGEFRRNEDFPLGCGLVIVDEVSMVDVPLMASLVRALDDGTGLVLVGDVDQLPSVGPGHVLGDIIDSGAVPVARLEEVFRQAAESQIITNAHRVNRGEEPDFVPADQGGDCIFVDAEKPEDGAAKIVEIVARRIPKRFGFPPSEVQVLSPMRKGPLGTEALNEALRAELNPGAPRLARQGGSGLSVGDKVMQIENDYEKEVYNGDIGAIRGIEPQGRSLAVEIGGKMLNYTFAELGKIVLAYAVTIHKSQGSEYPAVVVPLTTQHFIMLRRNLLYTAISRAKGLVVLVGQRKALHTAIRNATGRTRCTKLRDLLEGSREGGL